MAMKFENKKLNKEDHAKVDKEAGIARVALEGLVAIVGIGLVAKRVPWNKVANIANAASKVISRS